MNCGSVLPFPKIFEVISLKLLAGFHTILFEKVDPIAPFADNWEAVVRLLYKIEFVTVE